MGFEGTCKRGKPRQQAIPAAGASESARPVPSSLQGLLESTTMLLRQALAASWAAVEVAAVLPV